MINGVSDTRVEAADRGLLYGDGLFETIAVRQGRPCLWRAHLDRLRAGARRLGLPPPEPEALRAEVRHILRNTGHGVLRITLTRGLGQRGYRPTTPARPTRILAFYGEGQCVDGCRGEQGVEERSQPTLCRVRWCRTRLGLSPDLAGVKHLNRLEQVMARAEWQEPDIAEGLMTNTQGQVICGTMSNLFLITDAGLLTPSLARGGVRGTVRSLLIERARAHGIDVRVRPLSRLDVLRACGLLLTNAVRGPIVVGQLDDHRYDPAAVPMPLVNDVRSAAFSPEPRW